MTNEQDTREKLRDDAVDWLKDHFLCSTQIMSELDVWLDRQDAITKRHWMEINGANTLANIGLNKQLDKLKAENKRLSDRINGLLLELLIIAEKLGAEDVGNEKA